MNNSQGKSDAIKSFLQARSFAIIGVSRDEKKFSNAVFRELIKKNWKVFPVNPAVEETSGVKCYSSLSDIPGSVDAVITMVSKNNTLAAVQQAIDLNVKLIWIHQKTDTPEAVERCKDNNVTLITGECILMFADPVGSFHKFHRWINKMLGKYPTQV